MAAAAGAPLDEDAAADLGSAHVPDRIEGYVEELDADADSADDESHEDGPRRNPPREWSAPPPWLASAEAGRARPDEPPDFLAGRSDPARGLAGSAADLLAGGSPPRTPYPSRQPPPPDLPPRDADEHEFEDRDLPRPIVPPRRPRAYDQHLGGPSTAPDWERPRRYEAYPTIKSRMSVPAIPRLAGMAAAVAVAAIVLFLFGPPLLGIGTTDEPTASRSPSPSPSRSIAPTPTPAPTPVVYIIKSGDTLSKIAVANGLTIEQLLAANPEIKDPNKIVVGNSIIIPPPPSEVPDEFGGSASPSAAP